MIKTVIEGHFGTRYVKKEKCHFCKIGGVWIAYYLGIDIKNQIKNLKHVEKLNAKEAQNDKNV